MIAEEEGSCLAVHGRCSKDKFLALVETDAGFDFFEHIFILGPVGWQTSYSGLLEMCSLGGFAFCLKQILLFL